MKLSTRIKRYVAPEWIDGRKIKMLVDCSEEHDAATLEEADAIHATLLERGCKLLPQESPVVNANEIVMHYTSTTYKEWCNR